MSIHHHYIGCLTRCHGPICTRCPRQLYMLVHACSCIISLLPALPTAIGLLALGVCSNCGPLGSRLSWGDGAADCGGGDGARPPTN
eukprot:1159659-Pelagomonas_calceolata.AAC.4